MRIAFHLIERKITASAHRFPSNDYLFVVDPNGYWVTRVIPPVVNDR